MGAIGYRLWFDAIKPPYLVSKLWPAGRYRGYGEAMKGFRRVVSFLAAPLAVVFFVTSSGLTGAYAGLVTTEEAAQQLDTSLDRDALLSLIEREDVRQELIAHGVDPAQAAGPYRGAQRR